MIDFQYVYSWTWDKTDYSHPIGYFVELDLSDHALNGIAGLTGHLDVYVDRDHETQDPPPPGAVPVSTFVTLMIIPERYIIRHQLSSTGGFVRFGSLALDHSYAAYALGIQKQDGSGEWYVAEMYDRLIPTPD